MKSDVDVFLYILQADTDRRVPINAVDINSKLNINATSNDILNIQRFDESLLYGALELSFTMANKTSILKFNNVDTLESLNLGAFASNVVTNEEQLSNDIMYGNALNTEVDNSNSYTTTEIRAYIETQYTFTAPCTRTVDVTTGIFTIGIHSTTHITYTFTEIIDIPPPSRYGGSIRIIPALDNDDASIGFYNYMATRWTSVGDAWSCGVNCGDERGYTIATPVLNTCFNINLSGTGNIPYGLKTPAITVNDISASTAAYLTIKDNALITGYLSVSGDVNLATTLYVRTSQQNGGNLRCVPMIDKNESSMGFYTDAGDMWVSGLNCWGVAGSSIGANVKGMCLNITSAGNVNIPNNKKLLRLW